MIKRIISLVLLMTLFSTLLMSCHGGTSITPTADVADGLDPTRVYEITFWAKNENNATQ